jgi:regulator of CtrA degradation
MGVAFLDYQVHSQEQCIVNHAVKIDGPINLSARMLKSDIFNSIYSQVMAAVESTAQYLDGPGRSERSARGPRGDTAYSRSAMALTTHLMQLASQALMLKSLRDGAMGLDAAEAEFKKMQTVNRTDLSLADAPLLPAKLNELMEASVELKKKLGQFSGQLLNPVYEELPNQVHQQLSLLTTAFGR